MRLDLDFGNCSIKAQLSDAAGISPMVKFSDLQQLIAYCAHYPVTRACVLSVRHDPELHKALQQWLKQKFGIAPHYAPVHRQASGVTNVYQQPEQLGIDRWAGMIAAYHREQSFVRNNTDGSANNILVIDCGTAITLDWLEASGKHLAGVITPGLRLAYRTLEQNTHLKCAASPAYNTHNVHSAHHGYGLSALNWADQEIAWGTETAVRSGIDTMLNSFFHQQAVSTQHHFGDAYRIYLTGGDADYFQHHFPAEKRTHLADLTLQGLRLLLP